MTNTSMINYSTRDFATKEHLELYLLRQEKAFTPEVIKFFLRMPSCSAGLSPRSETRNIRFVLESSSSTGTKMPILPASLS